MTDAAPGTAREDPDLPPPSLLEGYRTAMEGAEACVLDLWLASARARESARIAAARTARLRADMAAAAAGFATAALASSPAWTTAAGLGKAAGCLPALGWAAGMAVYRWLSGERA